VPIEGPCLAGRLDADLATADRILAAALDPYKAEALDRDEP